MYLEWGQKRAFESVVLFFLFNLTTIIFYYIFLKSGIRESLIFHFEKYEF